MDCVICLVAAGETAGFDFVLKEMLQAQSGTELVRACEQRPSGQHGVAGASLSVHHPRRISVNAAACPLPYAAGGNPSKEFH